MPQVTDSDRILTFFAADDRPFFVCPMEDCSCIGTTDTRVSMPETRVTDEDHDFVLNNINRYLKNQLTREDIISDRCSPPQKQFPSNRLATALAPRRPARPSANEKLIIDLVSSFIILSLSLSLKRIALAGVQSLSFRWFLKMNLY